MKLTPELAKTLLLIAEAEDSGWKLWEMQFPAVPGLGEQWNGSWTPADDDSNPLLMADRLDIRIKTEPDEHWRALDTECPKCGDFWRTPDGTWQMLDSDEKAGWAWIVEGSQFRTFRPAP